MSASNRGTRMWRYAVLGIAINGFCYLLFLFLIWTGISAVAANGACYIVGAALGYLGNRSWTFGGSGAPHRQDLARFAAAHAIGFSTSIVSIALLVRIMPAPVAQIGAIGVAAVAIFIALEVLGFGRSRTVSRR